MRNRWARLLREGRAGDILPADGVLKAKGMNKPSTPSPKRPRSEGPRTPRQCWSREEDALILRSVEELGSKWSLIVARMPRRTEHAVRNRYNRLMLMSA